MGSNNLSVSRVGMSQDVLDQVVAVLVACNFEGVSITTGKETLEVTYYQSEGFAGGQTGLHRHDRDSAPESLRRQS